MKRFEKFGAGEGIQTPDPNLGKVRDPELPVFSGYASCWKNSRIAQKISLPLIDSHFWQSHFPAYPLLTPRLLQK
jgi:hypothetical protein